MIQQIMNGLTFQRTPTRSNVKKKIELKRSVQTQLNTNNNDMQMTIS